MIIKNTPIIDKKYLQGIDDTAFLASLESGIKISKLDPIDVFPSDGNNSLITWKRTLEEITSNISGHNTRKSPWLYKLQKMITSLREELDLYFHGLMPFKLHLKTLHVKHRETPELFCIQI